MERIVNELKRVAAEQGISPKQIAKKAGMDERTVYNTWNLKRLTRYYTIEEIAYTLGYKLDIRKKG